MGPRGKGPGPRDKGPGLGTKGQGYGALLVWGPIYRAPGLTKQVAIRCHIPVYIAFTGCPTAPVSLLKG